MKKVNKYTVLFLLFLLNGFLMNGQELLGSTISVDDKNFAIGQDVSISSDGKRIVTSGYGESSYGVKVYDFMGNDWVPQTDFNETEFPSETMVYATAISGDGNTIAVGSLRNRFNDNSGQVKLYKFFNGTWEQLGEPISAKTPNEYFGQKVVLSSNGNRVAVSAKYNSELGLNKGRVAVYEFINNAWQQIGQSIYGDEPGYKLGGSINMSTDGNTLIVGALSGYHNSDREDLNLSSGFSQIWSFKDSQWESQNRMKGDNADFFGISTAISGDARTFVVGAIQNGDEFGYITIYKYDEGDWLREFQIIKGVNLGSHFGRSIAISEDGNRIVVTAVATQDDETNNNTVRIYQFDEDKYRLLADFQGSVTKDNFGINTAMSSNGNIIAIGGLIYDFKNRDSRSGYIKTYDLSDLELSEDPPPSPNPPAPTSGNPVLYPNPVTDILLCEYCNKIASISIFDVSGKRILAIDKYKEENINLSRLQNGLYYVYVTDTNSEVFVHKIVKK